MEPGPLPMNGEAEVRLIGEEDKGEDGPGEDELGRGGVGLDVEGDGVLFLESLDLVRERFYRISIHSPVHRKSELGFQGRHNERKLLSPQGTRRSSNKAD